jgi:glutathione S-transferase
MTFMLYWSPFSGSLAPMAVLEEIQAPYEKTLIDIHAGNQLAAEYLKIHPLGLVPAMQLNNGEYIYESAGICMYLADRYLEYELAPAIDDQERGVYYQWMLFLASAIYPVFGRIAHPEWHITESSHLKEIKAAAISQQNRQWMVVEQVLEHRDWLLGEKFSSVDIYLQMLSTWNEDEEEFARMFPNVARVAAATAKRPGVQRALRLHAF